MDEMLKKQVEQTLERAESVREECYALQELLQLAEKRATKCLATLKHTREQWMAEQRIHGGVAEELSRFKKRWARLKQHAGDVANCSPEQIFAFVEELEEGQNEFLAQQDTSKEMRSEAVKGKVIETYYTVDRGEIAEWELGEDMQSLEPLVGMTLEIEGHARKVRALAVREFSFVPPYKAGSTVGLILHPIALDHQHPQTKVERRAERLEARVEQLGRKDVEVRTWIADQGKRLEVVEHAGLGFQTKVERAIEVSEERANHLGRRDAEVRTWLTRYGNRVTALENAQRDPSEMTPRGDHCPGCPEVEMNTDEGPEGTDEALARTQRELEYLRREVRVLNRAIQLEWRFDFLKIQQMVRAAREDLDIS